MEDLQRNKMLEQPVDQDTRDQTKTDPLGNSETSNSSQRQLDDGKRAFLAKVVELPTDADSSEDDETNVPYLCVDVNDVVTVEQDLDDKYILAKSDQLIGRLAKSSCRILDDQIPTTSCQYLTDNKLYNLHICFASFVAQDGGDLSITKGDIIVATSSVNEHWLQGQVCFDSQGDCWPKLIQSNHVGTFPLNHCWQLDTTRVESFCLRRLKLEQQSRLTIQSTPWSFVDINAKTVGTDAAKSSQNPTRSTNYSSSLSSGGSSSICSTYNSNNTANTNNNHNNTINNNNQRQCQEQIITQTHVQQTAAQAPQPRHDKVDGAVQKPPPPRPEQLPRQISNRQKSASEVAIVRPPSILSNKHQDKLKGWLHTVKKKTARCAMRISANLGLISLTRDEEFERHYESFKQLEKSIRVFVKNLTLFVDHFESFLLALQTTSDNLADFYRDKSHQREIVEMRKKNKALNCEHFHAFKRTVDRQVIAVASQLLQKFAGPHQLISKRSAKLLDYDTKTKEVESCRDLEKKTALREQYVIAKELYDRINGQLIEELPLFNGFALDIFRECILVLLESRRNFVMSYTKQTEALLKTPLLSSFTASDVASTIMMTCDFATQRPAEQPSHMQGPMENTMAPIPASSKGTNSDYCKSSQATSEHETQPSTSGTLGDGSSTRPSSALSQLSSEFDQMALNNREICSTPLSSVSGSRRHNQTLEEAVQQETQDTSDGGDNPFDEPDTVVRFAPSNSVASDNKQNESIESAIVASRAADGLKLGQPPGANGTPNHGGRAKKRRQRTKHEVLIASWPFVATGPNQLTISSNQPLKLLKGCDSIGNPDWSLVKNQLNEIGYVPTAYLKKKE